MSLDKKLFKAVATTTTTADAPQGLVLHLDANDEDSIDQGGANDGNTNGTWFDISTHDLNVPLVDKASNLQLHLNASDTTSYGGSGDEWTDISQNSNHAEDTSPTFSSDTRGYFEMDGSNDYFTIDYDASLYMTSNTGFTIEAWVNRDNNNEGYIIASDDGSTFPYAIQWHNNHGYYGWISGSSFSGTVGLGDTSSNGVGEWDHVVITQSSVDRKNRLYVNGTLIGTSAAVTGFHSTSSGVNIGAYWNEAAKFDGKIGVIRIYNVELTASELTQNFRAGNFFSYDSTYDTDLALHFDPTDIDNSSSTATWTDKIASLTLTENGTAEYEKELGNYVDLQGADYFGNDSATNTIKDTNGDFTLEFWINFNAHSGNNVILGVNQSSGVRGILLYYGSSTMDLYVYKNGTQSGSMYGTPSWSTLGISTSNWYHVVIRIDASDNMKFFVDGDLKATYANNAGGSHWTDMHNIRIGDDATLTYDISAKIGNFKIYSGLLSEAQVAQNYLATKNNYPNGNHATNNGATFTYSSTPYYFDFDGSDDYFTIPDNAAFDLIREQSMELWLYREGTGVQYIVDKATSNSSNYGWQFFYSTYGSGGYFFQMHNAPYSDATSITVASSVNTWEHIVVTCNGDKEWKLYKNGSLASTDSGLTGSVARTTQTLTFGQYFNGTNQFDGRIAMLKFYEKTLSSTEVAAAWNGTKSTFGY